MHGSRALTWHFTNSDIRKDIGNSGAWKRHLLAVTSLKKGTANTWSHLISNKKKTDWPSHIESVWTSLLIFANSDEIGKPKWTEQDLCSLDVHAKDGRHINSINWSNKLWLYCGAPWAPWKYQELLKAMKITLCEWNIFKTIISQI